MKQPQRNNHPSYTPTAPQSAMRGAAPTQHNETAHAAEPSQRAGSGRHAGGVLFLLIMISLKTQSAEVSQAPSGKRRIRP